MLRRNYTCISFVFWSPIKNREGLLKLVLSVHVCVTHYLKKRSIETWHEVVGKKCKKCSTAAFFRCLLVFSKTAHLCEKNTFLSIFGSFFGLCGKSVPRIFSLNFARMCQKIVLKDRTVVSPGKYDISEILGKVIYKNWRQNWRKKNNLKTIFF